MKSRESLYRRHRFPPEIIQYAVWLYHRFNLSHRDIEDLLARRGVLVIHESIRLWCNKFGPRYAHRLRRRHRGYGDTVFMDEVFVRIGGRQRYLWRAVDQDGEVIDVLLQERRDAAAARRFFRHVLAHLGGEPRTIATDKLGSYAVARRELLPSAAHDTHRYANNRAELSHQPTRVRERGMRRFKSMFQAQRFVRVRAAVSNLFSLGRHLVAAGHYRRLRQSAFASWDRAVAV
ncbi:MAG: transposase [Gammaproteobacteria bacterium SG8_30]|nr:MAG: transposase [Gammaproteobacteria bacterium SG8_30]